MATNALKIWRPNAQRSRARDAWPFELTDQKLARIMADIHRHCHDTAVEYDQPGNYVAGANVTGFLKVAKAMLALGVV